VDNKIIARTVRLFISALFVFGMVFCASKEANAQTSRAPTLYGWFTATGPNQTWNLGVNVVTSICTPLGFDGGFGYLASTWPGIYLGHTTINGSTYYQVSGSGNNLYNPKILIGCYTNSYLQSFGMEPGTYYSSNWTATAPASFSGSASTNMLPYNNNSFCWLDGVFDGTTNTGYALVSTPATAQTNGHFVLTATDNVSFVDYGGCNTWGTPLNGYEYTYNTIGASSSSGPITVNGTLCAFNELYGNWNAEINQSQITASITYISADTWQINTNSSYVEVTCVQSSNCVYYDPPCVF
jgi:hypothetical protein